jgi:arylsulfatase A-like enzyme
VARKILFVTTDQMRFDAIGVNGQKIARTPAIDKLARDGINYTRCHAQNVVCMPARSTMVTGQYVSTHGVWMNGVPLPADAPSVAR